jgi:hypothetical protein
MLQHACTKQELCMRAMLATASRQCQLISSCRHPNLADPITTFIQTNSLNSTQLAYKPVNC